MLRHEAVPPRPFGALRRARARLRRPEAATEAALREALEAHGAVRECARVESGVWAATYATHEQALAARAAGTAPAGATFLDTAYNERPYAGGGWTTLEKRGRDRGVSRAPASCRKSRRWRAAAAQARRHWRRRRRLGRWPSRRRRAARAEYAQAVVIYGALAQQHNLTTAAAVVVHTALTGAVTGIGNALVDTGARDGHCEPCGRLALTL